jgi:hypothetical protein
VQENAYNTKPYTYGEEWSASQTAISAALGLGWLAHDKQDRRRRRKEQDSVAQLPVCWQWPVW